MGTVNVIPTASKAGLGAMEFCDAELYVTPTPTSTSGIRLARARDPGVRRIACRAQRDQVGSNACAVVEHLLKSKPHPEQGYRACLGLLSLARQYGQGRLEAASTLAVKLRSPTRKSVLSILKTGRDQRPPAPAEQLDLPEHSNVRGPKYYN